jgi:hypothetical protein
VRAGCPKNAPTYAECCPEDEKSIHPSWARPNVLALALGCAGRGYSCRRRLPRATYSVLRRGDGSPTIESLECAVYRASPPTHGCPASRRRTDTRMPSIRSRVQLLCRATYGPRNLRAWRGLRHVQPLRTPVPFAGHARVCKKYGRRHGRRDRKRMRSTTPIRSNRVSAVAISG